MNNETIIYARLSREDEDKLDGKIESRSIENQIKLLTKYANEHGFKIVKVLYDDGYSGGTMDRPAFNELLKEVRNGSFKVLLVKDFSRLGRVMYAVGDFVDNVLPSHNIRLISVDDKYDSNDTQNDNDLSAVIKYFMNEYNLKDFKRKCRDARIHYANTKHLNYYPKFGYNFDEEGKEIVDEFSAAIVRRAFQLIDEFGYSTTKVAEIFNDENVPTRSFYAVYVLGLKPLHKQPSRIWNGEKIWEIVRDYEYCGHSLNWTRHKKEERILLKNTHIAIIDEDLFWRVQTIIDKRSKNKNKVEHIGRILFDRKTNRNLLYHKGSNVEYSALYFLRDNNIQTYSIRARMLEEVLYYDVIEVIEACLKNKEELYELYKKKLFPEKEIVVELASRNTNAASIAKKHNIRRETIYLWQKDLAGGPIMKKENQTKEELVSEIERLKKEQKALEMENQILKKANELLKKEIGANFENLTNKEKSIIVSALKNKYKIKDLLLYVKLKKTTYFYEINRIGIDKYKDIRKLIKIIFNC